MSTPDCPADLKATLQSEGGFAGMGESHEQNQSPGNRLGHQILRCYLVGRTRDSTRLTGKCGLLGFWQKYHTLLPAVPFIPGDQKESLHEAEQMQWKLLAG